MVESAARLIGLSVLAAAILANAAALGQTSTTPKSEIDRLFEMQQPDAIGAAGPSTYSQYFLATLHADKIQDIADRCLLIREGHDPDPAEGVRELWQRTSAFLASATSVERQAVNDAVAGCPVSWPEPLETLTERTAAISRLREDPDTQFQLLAQPGRPPTRIEWHDSSLSAGGPGKPSSAAADWSTSSSSAGGPGKPSSAAADWSTSSLSAGGPSKPLSAAPNWYDSSLSAGGPGQTFATVTDPSAAFAGATAAASAEVTTAATRAAIAAAMTAAHQVSQISAIPPASGCKHGTAGSCDRPSAAHQAQSPPPGGSNAASGAGAPVLAPLFPWPPPHPYASDTLSAATFTARGVRTFGQLADALLAPLRAAGYPGPNFFSAGDGFAMVTHLERVDGAGRPVDESQRWQDMDQASFALSSFNLRDICLALSHRRAGHFRLFVFVVSSNPVVPNANVEATIETILAWERTGLPGLPPAIAVHPLPAGYTVQVLLYQFTKEEGRSPGLVSDSSVGSQFRATGLKFE
jgi:hypothetical protein